MRKLFITFCLLCFGWQVNAQQDYLIGTKESSNNGLPGNFFQRTLDNGLQILVIEDNSVPLATIEICVHNGAYTEPPEFDGLSHLYEHMFFKANRNIPSQEQFMARVRELGISFNGTTSNERVNYFITLSNGKVEEGVEFMNSAIRYPLFLEEEMKKENPVVDGEFQRAESNPVFFLLNDMNRHMWGKHYSRKNVIGDHDVILGATPEQMRTIQNKFYYPNNSMIVIAGDVKHVEVYKTVEKIMGDWLPSEFEIFERNPIPEFEPLEENKYFATINENTKVPIIAIGLHGPDTRSDIPATYAADVFSFILGQKTSRLQKEMVDDGLALQVQVSYQTCRYVGPITIFLVPNPERVQEAYAKVLEHIELWDSEDYFTVEQMNTAKNLLAIDDTYGKESTSSFVHTVTYWWASADISYYTNYVENLYKVTDEDIKEYVSKYIKGKPMVTGILLSEEMRGQIGFEDAETFFSNP